jgi:hypothetical protein
MLDGRSADEGKCLHAEGVAQAGTDFFTARYSGTDHGVTLMRRQVYLLAALAAVSFATADAQTQGTQSAPPGAQTPVRQPATSPSPAQPTQSNTQPNAQQTVRPPDTRTPTTTTSNPATNNSVDNPTSQQDRVPPAARGVGTTANKPNCSSLRGLEKAECERRDTVRDDLPAGVTTTQPKDSKAKDPRSK